MTCRIVGLVSGLGCEHNKPSLRTVSISSTGKSPPSLGSPVASSVPFFQFSSTQSRSSNCCPAAPGSTGLLPQATSRRNAPKANTSVLVVAFPVWASSGARYPIVPTICVVWASVP
ncbi:L-type lectin-domain containing receptor kinase IV.2-like [Iris pallida]|uniref:L-type lectin-domain containing receptor kinase IV.2-like n=1 Tax=Iris pallida TaxID=29817 RepID=A0AAX6GW62_IRIPA|nr:L-type lectin-domain containing receptor kinase IV.2-like [Iris pallida]